MRMQVVSLLAALLAWSALAAAPGHARVEAGVRVAVASQAAVAGATPTDAGPAGRAARRADQARATGETATPGVALSGVVFMLATGLLGLLGFLAPVLGLVRWRGLWRVAAAAPAVLMAWVVLRIVADGLRDPASHALWPFEVLTAGIASVIAIGVLAVLRRIIAGTVGMVRSRG